MQAEKANHAVRCLCRVLHVTPSGYYAWAKRPPSRRQRTDLQLTARIRAIHTASRGTYGSPRIDKQLRQDGCTAGRERVARLLRDMGLMGLPPASGAGVPRTVTTSGRSRPTCSTG